MSRPRSRGYNILRTTVVSIVASAAGIAALAGLARGLSEDNYPEAVQSPVPIPPMFKVELDRPGLTLLQGCFRDTTSHNPGDVGTIALTTATNNEWKVTFDPYNDAHEKHTLDLKDIDNLQVYEPESPDGLYSGGESYHSVSTDEKGDKTVRCTIALPQISEYEIPQLPAFNHRFATIVQNEVGGVSYMDGPYDATTHMTDAGAQTQTGNEWVNVDRISVVNYPLLDPPYRAVR